VIEEFQKLTRNQKAELSKGINELAQSLVNNGHLTSTQQVTSWQHVAVNNPRMHVGFTSSKSTGDKNLIDNIMITIN